MCVRVKDHKKDIQKDTSKNIKFAYVCAFVVTKSELSVAPRTRVNIRFA